MASVNSSPYKEFEPKIQRQLWANGASPSSVATAGWCVICLCRWGHSREEKVFFAARRLSGSFRWWSSDLAAATCGFKCVASQSAWHLFVSAGGTGTACAIGALEVWAEGDQNWWTCEPSKLL